MKWGNQGLQNGLSRAVALGEACIRGPQCPPRGLMQDSTAAVMAASMQSGQGSQFLIANQDTRQRHYGDDKKLYILDYDGDEYYLNNKIFHLLF
ncbi:hypothetical protein VTP01DRAFT_7189 [Rhizomucor pusillus]|uniref:uncharacterized protein n=1 Tax=Rhizomucor pusillus TaxID=4840 RepID=UPI0037441391